MNRNEFFAELRSALSGLPEADLEERIDFYAEMIDDRIEDGLTEAEAVASIGTPDEVASEILSEIPLTRLVKEKLSPNRSLKAWEIVLLILGCPVWLPLLLAAAAVVLSLYAAVWAVIAACWVVFAAVCLSSAACIVACVVSFTRSAALTAFAFLGAAAVCAGLSVLLFFGCREVSRALIRLSGKIVLNIKRRFAGKESEHEEID